MKTKSTFRNHANNFLTHTKGSRGITLIALVITIIVLLILAAVSIATLTGDNGILTKAQDASENSKEAEEDERVKLVVATALSDNLGEGLTTSTLKNAIEKEFGEDKKANLEGEENGPWTFKGERNNYTINKDGLIETDTREGVSYSKLKVGDYISNYPVYYKSLPTTTSRKN